MLVFESFGRHVEFTDFACFYKAFGRQHLDFACFCKVFRRQHLDFACFYSVCVQFEAFVWALV